MKIELTYLQLVLIGMGVGLILGLIPLVLGIIKGEKKLAIWALIASILAGAAQSFLALITVIVFIWLIFRKSAEPKAVENLPVKDSPNPSKSENETSGD